MAAEGAQGGGHTLQSRARTHTDRPQPLHQAATRSPSARTAQRPPVELAYVLVFTTSCRRHPADKEAAHLDLRRREQPESWRRSSRRRRRGAMEYHSSGSLPLLGRPRYCPGANANGGYLCETGHCCGESGCCTYYYELWWFWLLWTVLILFSCCCAYRHRRAKLRVQQQQRQRDISLLAYQGASSFPSSMLDLSFLASLKLPSYEEVAAQPSTPPPPYSSVFTAPQYPQPPRTMDPHLLTQQHPGTLLHRPLQPLSDGPSSLSSDNSSSCSCDSCCPSSPCSSSLSAPVTYETDTSHTSTPSEATPLTLDSVTIETITAAATRLDKGDSSALPVNANWDDEESEEQGDEEYCEDSDVAADESQYKHRRLTGDSGIEVCRCRIEDEDEEDDDKEDLKPDIGKDGSEKKLYVGSSELHDSLDCPVRSQKSAAEDVDLCNTEMKGSDEKAAIPVETV
uniref:WW domain binding protein 1 n=1 Tax=Knipowitschia caucasica TaxID=637954 RepID=A0AAV2KLX5_KNICA